MGALYVVATPIGNMGDITFRAVEVLKKVDCILCEDTRVTRKLTQRFGIQKPLRSHFAGNEEERAAQVVQELSEGRNMALVTDAGTPCISDPGYLLVRACRAQGIPVIAVPGPSALSAGLSVCGLPTTRVLFLGFPPRRKTERQRLLRSLRTDPATLVFYEAPHRIRALLADALTLLPGRECVVERELTKRFESVAVVTDAAAVPERGELVVIFGPPSGAVPREEASREEVAERVARLISEGVEEKEALRRVAKERRVPRREIYRMVKVKEP